MITEALQILAYPLGLGVILCFLHEDGYLDLKDRIEWLFGGISFNMPKDPHWPRA